MRLIPPALSNLYLQSLGDTLVSLLLAVDSVFSNCYFFFLANMITRDSNRWMESLPRKSRQTYKNHRPLTRIGIRVLPTPIQAPSLIQAPKNITLCKDGQKRSPRKSLGLMLDVSPRKTATTVEQRAFVEKWFFFFAEQKGERIRIDS